MSLVITQLPAAVTAMAPELLGLDLPDEVRADCLSCHMVPERWPCPTAAEPFLAETRCCTYHPMMPNFLVGRALERGGASAERVMARLTEPSGHWPAGIGPPYGSSAGPAEIDPADFGRRLELRCPYWVGGEHTCGVWADRPAVCRTWFCRYVDGPRGATLWDQVREVLESIEGRLAEHCVARGGAPEAGAGPEVWAQWYRLCAHRIATLTTERAAELRDAALDAQLEELDRRVHRLEVPIPDRLIPTVASVEPTETGVRLVGYSEYDARELPGTIFALLSALDEGRSWRDIPSLSQADRDTVADLFRAGIVSPPGSSGRPTPGGEPLGDGDEA